MCPHHTNCILQEDVLDNWLGIKQKLKSQLLKQSARVICILRQIYECFVNKVGTLLNKRQVHSLEGPYYCQGQNEKLA